MLPRPWDDEFLHRDLGFSAVEVEAARNGETASAGPAKPRFSRVLAEELSWRPLPYPGGRHPRLGFRDGAVNPRRETKLLVGIPDLPGYLVLDLPEAIWSDEELILLAHEHVPTRWDRHGEREEFGPWRISDDALTAANDHLLPDGSIVSAEAARSSDSRIDLMLRISNGTDREFTNVWAQTCLIVARTDLPPDEQPDVDLSGDTATLRLRDGRRLDLTWERVQRTWQNPPVPCMHSDPFLGSCAPGDSVAVHGSLTLR